MAISYYGEGFLKRGTGSYEIDASNNGTESVNGEYAFPFDKDKNSYYSSTMVEHYNVGVYYNWIAATAGDESSFASAEGTTLNADQSICPANWRLPTGSHAMKKDGTYGSDNDFADLIEAYNILDSRSETFNDYPIYIAGAGYKTATNDEAFNTIEQFSGSYWTSTVHGAPNVDRFSFEHRIDKTPTIDRNSIGDMNVSIDERLGAGRSVRCIARAPYAYTVNYVLEGSETAPESRTIETWTPGSAKIKVSSNQYLRSTTFLSGWSTVNGATVPEYSPGDTITLTSEEITLYAVWSPYTEFRFHAGEGSFDSGADNKNNLIKVKAGETDRRTIVSSRCESGNINSMEYYASGSREKISRDDDCYVYGGGSDSYANIDGATALDVTVYYSVDDANGHHDPGYLYDTVSDYWGYHMRPSSDPILGDQEIEKRGYERVYRKTTYGNFVNIELPTDSKSYGYWLEAVSHERTVQIGEYKEPSREGYSFMGWSTVANATEPNWDYYDSASSSSVDLYPVWKKFPTISFQAEGGHFGNDLSNTENTVTMTLTPPQLIGIGSKDVYSRRDYSKCSGTHYIGNKSYEDIVTIPGAKRLYVNLEYNFLDGGVSIRKPNGNSVASYSYHNYYSTYMTFWDNIGMSGNTVNISFNNNSYSRECNPAYGYDATVYGYGYDGAAIHSGEVLTPTRDGYTFVGWATTPGAAEPDWELVGDTYVEDSLTLYAVWKRDAVLTFNAGEGDFYGDANTNSKTNSMTVRYHAGVSLEDKTKTISSWCYSGSKYYYRKSNIDDECQYSQEDYYERVTIPGAKQIEVTTYYAFGSEDDYVTVSNGKREDSAEYRSGGKLSGSSEDAWSSTYKHIHRGVFDGDSVEIYASNYNSQSYGYWMEITGKFPHEVVSGQYRIPQREGYLFAGWATTPGATVSDWEYDEYEYYGDPVTLYAVWAEKDTVTITFHANNGQFDGGTENSMELISRLDDQYVGSETKGVWSNFNSVNSLSVTIPGANKIYYRARKTRGNNSYGSGSMTICGYDHPVSTSAATDACNGAIYRDDSNRYGIYSYQVANSNTVAVVDFNYNASGNHYALILDAIGIATVQPVISGEYKTPTRSGYTFIGWATTAGADNPNWEYNEHSRYTASTDVYAVWAKNTTINFNATDGGTFANSATVNQVELSAIEDYRQELVTKNLSSNDANGVPKNSINDASIYGNGQSYTKTVSFPGAESITATVYYGTGGSSTYDWLCVYAPGVAINTYCSNSLSGRLGGSYSYPSLSTWSGTINGDSASIYFRSDGSGGYYGYWAEFSAVVYTKQQIVSGEILTPTRSDHNFLGWSTTEGATEPDWTYDPNTWYEGTIELYAVWD